MSRRRFARAWPAVALVLMLVLASCTRGSSHSSASSETTAAPRASVLVTIGSGATFGIGLEGRLSDTWAQRFYYLAFPESTVLVNAADRLVSVAAAAALQVPLALEQHATVVAVWLGDVDLEAGIPAVTFRAQLDGLVERLRDSGARVLVGNLSTAKPGAVAYDNAITSVARARGATLVDLAAALSATPGIGPTSATTTAVAARIADAFVVALKGS